MKTKTISYKVGQHTFTREVLDVPASYLPRIGDVVLLLQNQRASEWVCENSHFSTRDPNIHVLALGPGNEWPEEEVTQVFDVRVTYHAPKSMTPKRLQRLIKKIWYGAKIIVTEKAASPPSEQETRQEPFGAAISDRIYAWLGFNDHLLMEKDIREMQRIADDARGVAE